MRDSEPYFSSCHEQLALRIPRPGGPEVDITDTAAQAWTHPSEVLLQKGETLLMQKLGKGGRCWASPGIWQKYEMTQKTLPWLQAVRQCTAQLANGNGSNGSSGHIVPSAWPGRVVIPEKTSGMGCKVRLVHVMGTTLDEYASTGYSLTRWTHALPPMCRNSPSWDQQAQSELRRLTSSGSTRTILNWWRLRQAVTSNCWLNR